MSEPITISKLSFPTPLLESVLALHRLNSKTLGFLPAGAFEENAKLRRILVAMEGQALCGYLLYRVARGRAAIVHLCVSREARGKGVARALVEQLKRETKPLEGIGLRCRRDYDINHVWSKFGFEAVHSKAGRGKDGAELTYWWFGHGHADLFSRAAEPDPVRQRVVVDANVFYDLHARETRESEDSKALLADWVQASIELVITKELRNEIEKAGYEEQRRASRVEATRYHTLSSDDVIFQRLCGELRSQFPESATLRDEADLRQLAYAIAAGAPFLVTRDQTLIERAEPLYRSHGLMVLHPVYQGVDGLAEMWPKYRAALDRDGALDFDDQIYRAIEVLLTDPEAREVAQRACRLLLVDEFQDLTPAHVLLVRLLSAPGFGVFGVGDDDQTIYGYSGANPEWLIEFESLFPGAGSHPLEVNYRCPGDVVVAADRLVRHNRRRVAKVIRSVRPDTTGLEVVTSTETLTTTLEVVRDAVAAGRLTSDIAVLARVNALLAPVQVGLVSSGIAVQGGVGTEFLERTAVRAALSWLRLAVAGESLDGRDLAEALRRPSRPMHPNVANWVAEQSSLAGLRRLAGRINTERDAARVASFADDIARLQRMAIHGTAADLLSSLADDVGLGAAIATLDDGRHGMNRAAQNDDLVAMAQLAALHPDPATFGDWLREQLSTARSDGGVVLATVHRVKGQEWPLVVIHHAEADQYPHRLAEDFEEERRVFHVAITRGSERVVVVVGADPSPFVQDMVTEPSSRADEPLGRAGESSRRNPIAPLAQPKPKSPTRDTQFDKATVLAAAGIVLVDGGQDWTIEAVEDAAAVARHGGVTRRFSFGSSVVTIGRQRGALRPPGQGGPTEESVRAHDLLRQARERLRAGKPAYVVFDDKTLEAIALALPTSLRALSSIPGIGPAKLELYGDAVLVAIEDAMASPDEREGSSG